MCFQAFYCRRLVRILSFTLDDFHVLDMHMDQALNTARGYANPGQDHQQDMLQLKRRDEMCAAGAQICTRNFLPCIPANLCTVDDVVWVDYERASGTIWR